MLLLWMWLAQGSDAISTCQAINSERFREGNALLPNNCMKIASIKTGISAGVTALALMHNTKAMKIGVSINASSSSVAVGFNIYQMRK